MIKTIVKTLPIDIEVIENDFNANTSQLTKEELSPELIVNFLVGPIRSNLQNKSFEKAIDDIMFLAFMREKTLKPREALKRNLREMYEMNDPCIAMLYNLVFLRFLASIYGKEEVKYRVNGWVTKYSNELVTR